VAGAQAGGRQWFIQHCSGSHGRAHPYAQLHDAASLDLRFDELFPATVRSAVLDSGPEQISCTMPMPRAERAERSSLSNCANRF
jgi:hypothetical protein